MSVSGISHLTFVVADLERAAAFWLGIFDAKPVYASGDRTFSISRERFFIVGGVWIAIMEGEPRLDRSYDHTAFKVDETDFDALVERIRGSGVETREPRSRVEGEGRSVYFHDHDNHLFELHTGTREERLARYARASQT